MLRVSNFSLLCAPNRRRHAAGIAAGFAMALALPLAIGAAPSAAQGSGTTSPWGDVVDSTGGNEDTAGEAAGETAGEAAGETTGETAEEAAETLEAAVPHFHGDALHSHVDGQEDHHHHGGRLTHSHVQGDGWHHHHGDEAHDHPGTDVVHHHHADDDSSTQPEEGHNHEASQNPHDHLAQTFCPPGRPCLTGGEFAVWPRARFIGGYEFIQPDNNNPFIGQNDGFLLEQVRVGMDGTWRGRLGFKFTYDAISPLRNDDVNDPVRRIVAGIRDAYLVYQPIDVVKIWLGNHYMPADIEGQTSRGELNFTSRSVMSGGVRAGRGTPETGLSVIRELGLTVGNDDLVVFTLGRNDIALDYRLAISNGNGIDVVGNDNKLPAVFGRVGVRYGDYLSVGGGGQYNPRTQGIRPSLYAETESSGFADVTFDMFGVRAVASGIYRWTTFDSLLPSGDPNRTQAAFGFATWLSVENPFGLDTFGLRPAVRLSYYEPGTDIDSDQVFETTFAVRYTPPTGLPLSLIVDATLLFEPGPAAQQQIDNHRVTALLVFDL